MIRPSLDASNSSGLRTRQNRRSQTRRHHPAFEHLEDRCLLTTYTTPPAFLPIAEMVYGPVGDLWFSRIEDLSITRIASDGTLTVFGIPPHTAQPVGLEVDANDNLWFSSAANPPANHLFKMTPAGVVTEISDFTEVFSWVNQQFPLPIAFLTHGHINPDDSGALVALNGDGTVGFYPLPTALPVGPGPYGNRALSVAIDARGDAWYTDDNAVSRYTAESEYDYHPLPDPNDVAASIALGGDGNMWFVENSIHVSSDAYYVADKIGRITPNGTITTFDVKLAGFRLKIGPLVRGTDGSLWFDQVGVEEDGVTPEPNTHRIGRIAADGTITRFIPPDSVAGAAAITVNAVSPAGGVADSPISFSTTVTPQSSIVEVHSFSELTPVNPVNYAPVAVNDSYTVAPGSTLTSARPGILGNDTDANGDALRAILLTGPSNGTLALNLNGSFTYTPNAGFNGSDGFTYKANDGLLDSGPATVSILVPRGGTDPAPPAQLAAFASIITHSQEHYVQFVSNAYQQFLGRKPDDAGLNMWVNKMQAGLTDEQLEAGFIGSAEYIARYGGAGAAWVQGLYLSILGRTPAQSELNSWVSQLNSGVSPRTVAFGFAASREREGNRVRADYQTFLGRIPAQSEIDSWVNNFAGGLGNEGLVAGFLGSFEYYNNAVKGRGNNLDWIKSATQDELGRPATTAEINVALTALLPVNLLQVANSITHSVDQYRLFVSNAYQTYLGRAPDTAGLNGWVSAMQNGLTDEHLEAKFLGSAEYIAKHGGPGAGWVTGMYNDLLKRTPSAAEVQSWVNALNHGASTEMVAFGFAASAEREGIRVRNDYFTYLGRTPSQPEVDGWVNHFTHGLTNENLVAGFIGSYEYYNAAQKGKSDESDWVASAIGDVLQRVATTADFTTYGGGLQ